MKSFLTEIKKTKGKLVWAVPAGILLLDFVWMYWIMSRWDKDTDFAEGYYSLLMNLPIVNTITVPIMAAVLASRLCDMENRGNTYKLLCTLQEKGSIFRNKLLLGSLHLLVFALLQSGMIVVLGRRWRLTQELPTEQMGYFFFSTLAVSVVLLLLQEILSLQMDNQLYPLFIGLIGTFAGLFSWFFPDLPLRYLIPWGYYCVGSTVEIAVWDEETRYMQLGTVPFSYAAFAALLLFAALLYAYGKKRFMEKEV